MEEGVEVEPCCSCEAEGEEESGYAEDEAGEVH